MQRVTAPVAYKEYQIAASTTHSAGQLLAFANPSGRQRLILEAVGQRIFFKFGALSSVEADATIGSNAAADGNFSIPAGAIFEIEIPANLKYVSVEAAASTGTAIIKLCDSAL